MGPFSMPWLTFTAFIVIGASILIAIIWALLDTRRDGSGGSREGGVKR